MIQGVSERVEATSHEQTAQIEEASATINQWQAAYEQLNLQLKASQVINNITFQLGDQILSQTNFVL